ncbi:aminotransferase class I/II-fold pyridoxal phosphate-dependent enzyme [Cohnella xylanilytica]|uniref:Aminotransferase class I/II-fold pyridoxal phosphate-dependent enzyme n=1 Tax=Cohnella xylanilytica TaxID=557555 RepID=A0A841U338_9BACL|nr:aminotransferase class I/II-fold pyridoxal phosphate-dependent enzyme [Cohnella xylanilytica]MBB6692490.1 aminotransferase class I/II-fold pyridoxal phosphate-dependent enzyme [Cohnella xylanilytica]
MPLDAERAPLYEALARRAGNNPAAFHVPGHKQRAEWTAAVGDASRRFAELLPLDVTELPDTDDLHHPEGVIAEAEALAADCFGAEETRFLVGGSTAGNLAMILAVCRPGELLLVQRNVHKSVIHGLMLSGARTVFLPPAIDPGSGLAIAPSADTVREALRRHPDAKGLLLANPNYYGMSVELAPIVRESHAMGIPVLVDEAHGPHFGRHSAFPESALQAGADIVVQSAHKMLSAMTMGAYLHMQGDRVSRASIRQYLRMIQSSSPSYPILASLDLARRELHARKEEAFAEALRTAGEIRAVLADSAYGIVPAGPHVRIDPLKLTLFDASGTLDGFRLQAELEKHGCSAEMADDRYVVLALGTGSRPEDGRRLLAALEKIAVKYELRDPQPNLIFRALPAYPEEIPEPVVLSRGAETEDSEPVPLEEAEGRVSAEWIIPYPPGIPALYPGETITPAIIRELHQWRKQGARIQGAEDGTLGTVRVARS